MTPYQEEVLLPAIKHITRSTSKAASTAKIAQYLGKPERTIRRYLTETEKAGALRRVGQRKGWLVAA